MLAARLYRAIDMYCSEPGCDCCVALVSFDGVDPDGDCAGGVWVHESRKPEFEPEGDAALLEELWAAFQLRHPRHLQRFRNRDAQIKALTPSPPPSQTVVTGPKVGRNAPCPCGSGKKYKKCCGRPGQSAEGKRARGH